MNINDKSLSDKIDRWLEKNTDNIIRDIISFVNIKSVTSERYKKFPYGVGCAKVLDKALEMSEDYGFKSKNHEYYCGTCELPGKTNEKEIGMFAHLDVVPEGDKDKWTYEPYNATVKDGYIIGRGAGDNKGPAISSLYVMKFLKDNEITLNNRVKLFFGCAEETGMADIEYYVKHNKAPDFSIVPDARFPVCYAEKGVLEITASADIKTGNLIEFNAGEVTNVVPAYAYAIVDDLNFDKAVLFPCDEGFEVARLDNGIKIGAFGSSKHAAFPEGSVNAIEKLASALIKHNVLTGNSVAAVKFISDSLADYNGVSIGIDYEDEPSGKLTHIAGIVKFADGKLSVNYNIRYPVTVNTDEMMNKVRKTFTDAGFNICTLKNNSPAFISPDDPIVKLLSDISNSVLQVEDEPYFMGGGTYARKLPRAVSYGPSIKDEKKPLPDGSGDAHQPDECVRIENLLNGIKVYIYALLSIDEYLNNN